MVQVTFVPTFMVTVSGTKAKLLMSMFTSSEIGVAVGVAVVVTVGVAVDVAVGVAVGVAEGVTVVVCVAFMDVGGFVVSSRRVGVQGGLGA